VVIVACSGCSGDATDEPALGQSKDADALTVQRNARRIADLKQKMADERAAARRDREAQATESASGSLPGFESFAASLGGQVGVAVGRSGGGAVAVAGSLQTGAAWSTIKVPIAARVILDRGGPSNITSAERALIDRAITASDNAAAAQLWAELSERHGGAQGAATAVAEILASAGDSSTSVSTVGRGGFSPYGQTEWSLREQQRFLAAVAGGCLDRSVGGDYLLEVMGRVIPSQRWGLGSTGANARLKGGWGPGPDGGYLVRQMGVIDGPKGELVAAIAALPSDGSLASGTAMLDQVAGWLVDHASQLSGGGPGGC
jgi:hypothetical protein